jgi:hypothetical protein
VLFAYLFFAEFHKGFESWALVLLTMYQHEQWTRERPKRRIKYHQLAFFAQRFVASFEMHDIPKPPATIFKIASL